MGETLVTYRQTLFHLLRIIGSKKLMMLLFTLTFLAMSVPVNIGVLAVTTHDVPTRFVLNDGTVQGVGAADPTALFGGLDQFLELTIPYFNYPLFWAEFRAINPFFVTLHYVLDLIPLSGMLAGYLTLSTVYRGQIRSRCSKRMTAVGSASGAASIGSGSIMSSVAAATCCGGAAYGINAIHVAGIALTSPMIVSISRGAILGLMFVLGVAILRISSKIRSGGGSGISTSR